MTEINHSRKPDDGWSEPLWERQGTESDRAFEAFTLYRDMGPARSAAKIAEALSKSTRLIARWSTEWGWVERASAWDDEADRNQRTRDQEEARLSRRKMLDGHASIGRAVTLIAAKELEKFGEVEPGKVRRDASRMGPLELAKLAQIGAQMERLARGESTERVEVKDAQLMVDGLVDLCLSYLPLESHEAFLTDIDARLGVSGMSVR